MAHHRAYEQFVLETLVPFIREDCRTSGIPIAATGCSVGALYSALFVLKHPETFRQGLCLSGRYRLSTFFNAGLAGIDVDHGRASSERTRALATGSALPSP